MSGLLDISVITPWYGQPQLVADYFHAVELANEVVIVDNGSDTTTRGALTDACRRSGAKLLQNDDNLGFSIACDQGIKASTGEFLVFLNSDVIGDPNWLPILLDGARDGILYGPSLQSKNVVDVTVPYLEGWCIAGSRAIFDAVGGWSGGGSHLLYWEDNDLCLRALLRGVRLCRRNLPLKHLRGRSVTVDSYQKAQLVERGRSSFVATVSSLSHSDRQRLRELEFIVALGPEC